MVCPYCKKIMKTGGIRQDRYPLKWMEGEAAAGIMYPFKKGVMLTNYLEKSYVTAYYCKDCGKIVIDLKENRGE